MVGLTVELVAWNIELGRTVFGHGQGEGPVGQLGHAGVALHLDLVLGDLFEDRHLVSLLEAAEALTTDSGLRGDADHRGVGPVGRGDGSHEICDPGPVLGDANSVASADPAVTVGHVGRGLLVGHRVEPDAGRFENVEGVHVGGPDNPEYVGDAVAGQGLYECLAGAHVGHGALLWFSAAGVGGTAGETL